MNRRGVKPLARVTVSGFELKSVFLQSLFITDPTVPLTIQGTARKMYMDLYVELKDWRKSPGPSWRAGLEVGLQEMAALVMAFERW